MKPRKSADLTDITDMILHLARADASQTDEPAESRRALRSNAYNFASLRHSRCVRRARYFFFAKTSSTTAQMPAIVKGLEITR